MSSAMVSITYTRRPLWLKVQRPLRIWLLRREIAGAETYLRYARRGGVLNARELDTLACNITPLRTALAFWQAA